MKPSLWILNEKKKHNIKPFFMAGKKNQSPPFRNKKEQKRNTGYSTEDSFCAKIF